MFVLLFSSYQSQSSCVDDISTFCFQVWWTKCYELRWDTKIKKRKVKKKASVVRNFREMRKWNKPGLGFYYILFLYIIMNNYFWTIWFDWWTERISKFQRITTKFWAHSLFTFRYSKYFAKTWMSTYYLMHDLNFLRS